MVGDARYELRDFVVFLPGIMGSTLSRDGVLVWGPSAGAALRAVRTFGGSCRSCGCRTVLGMSIPVTGLSRSR